MAAGFADQASKQFAGGQYRKVIDVIEGGAARADSTRRAIAALGASECNVLLHDAARPLLDQRIIADCVTALGRYQAVGVVVPSPDTIVVVSDGVLTGMPDRESLRRCQTPQGFRLSVIKRAHELALGDPAFADVAATDDCGVVLRYLPEVAIHVVPGQRAEHQDHLPVRSCCRRGHAHRLTDRQRTGPKPGELLNLVLTSTHGQVNLFSCSSMWLVAGYA